MDGALNAGPPGAGEGEALGACMAASADSGAWNQALVWIAATRQQAQANPRHAEAGQECAPVRRRINVGLETFSK